MAPVMARDILYKAANEQSILQVNLLEAGEIDWTGTFPKQYAVVNTYKGGRRCDTQ